MPDSNATSDDIVLVAFVDEMKPMLPAHDERKQHRATDALPSVDGLRVMVQRTFQH